MRLLKILHLAVLRCPLIAGAAFAQDMPNILVIWGDDIGTTNIMGRRHRDDQYQF